MTSYRRFSGTPVETARAKIPLAAASIVRSDSPARRHLADCAEATSQTLLRSKAQRHLLVGGQLGATQNCSRLATLNSEKSDATAMLSGQSCPMMKSVLRSPSPGLLLRHQPRAQRGLPHVWRNTGPGFSAPSCAPLLAVTSRAE